MVRSLIPTKLSRPLDTFEREMEHMMARLLGPEQGWLTSTPGFSPEVNLVETDGQFQLKVDIPGMKPEDLNVELKDGSVWVSGVKQTEEEEKGKTFHRIERHYGEFRRVIPLPTPVDDTKVEAEYHDGVLTVTIPKSEESKPKHIEVKT